MEAVKIFAVLQKQMTALKRLLRLLLPFITQVARVCFTVDLN